MIRQVVIAAIGILASVPCSASLVEWSLDGTTGSQTTQPATFALANLTAYDITRGAGLIATAAGNSFSTSGWTGQSTDYISLGFTVADGFKVDLDDLLIGTRSSNTGPGSVGLYYSGDNFTAALYTFSQSGTSFLNSDVDLSSLTGLTGAVEFRLIAIGTNSANGGTTASGGTFRITDYFVGSTSSPVQFNGTLAAIPEPTSALIGTLLAGAFGLMVARRPAVRD